MNELQFTGFQESTTLDSRIVAQMLDKNHSDLIRDIKKYTEYLGESKIAFTDFFQESQYITTQNKILPNYQITKKGCEFLAHKLTGQKGAIFTAKDTWNTGVFYIAKKNKNFSKKTLDFWSTISYTIFTVREYLTSRARERRKNGRNDKRTTKNLR